MSSSDKADYEQRDRTRADRYAGGYGRTAFAGHDNSMGRERRGDAFENGDRNFWTRSVDEVRSWFGDDEAERRRIHDEEERMRQDQIGAYHNHAYIDDRREADDTREDGRSRERSRSDRSRSDRGSWDSSRGYGSNIDRDYGRDVQRSARIDNDRSDARYFRSSNEYGGSRNRDYYRDYPTHNSGRSTQNNEDDEMKHGYENQSDYHEASNMTGDRMFGGRAYERNYPTRAERDVDPHTHELSGGWQSNDSHRGYRSLNNTGRIGIGQDNQLGKERDDKPNYQDQNYSRGNYTPNLNAGGQEYDSRHYEQRGRMGTAINEHAQRGYSEGYGRTGYSLDRPGNYANAESNKSRHPKNYKGADDRIYVDVCEALGRELDASDIEVTSSGSEITLTGSVGSREEKRRAGRIAEGVRGVEDVHNRLTLKAAASSQSSTPSSGPTQAGASDDSQAPREGANGGARASLQNGSGKAPSRK